MLGWGIVHLHSAVVLAVIVLNDDGVAVVSRVWDVWVEHAACLCLWFV
jgi:hypothetical protein